MLKKIYKIIVKLFLSKYWSYNKEAESQRKKDWYKKNREKILESRKTEEKREKNRQYCKKYRESKLAKNSN